MFEQGGITTANLASETALFVESAFGSEEKSKLQNYGYVQFYRSGEYHHNSPILMKSLHKVLHHNCLNVVIAVGNADDIMFTLER
jgi:glutamate synthase domain-containing protein 2